MTVGKNLHVIYGFQRYYTKCAMTQSYNISFNKHFQLVACHFSKVSNRIYTSIVSSTIESMFEIVLRWVFAFWSFSLDFVLNQVFFFHILCLTTLSSFFLGFWIFARNILSPFCVVNIPAIVVTVITVCIVFIQIFFDFIALMHFSMSNYQFSSLNWFVLSLKTIITWLMSILFCQIFFLVVDPTNVLSQLLFLQFLTKSETFEFSIQKLVKYSNQKRSFVEICIAIIFFPVTTHCRFKHGIWKQPEIMVGGHNINSDCILWFWTHFHDKILNRTVAYTDDFREEEKKLYVDRQSVCELRA